MIQSSCIYTGYVMHRRLRPRSHHLKQRVFWMLLDLDEIESLSSKLMVFSFNRFNLVSFHTKDHGDCSHAPLRSQITKSLEEAGLESASHKIFLLCMPRILGYGFNPLSVFFCYDGDGWLSAIVYEVHNTFGERHSYIIPCPHEKRAFIAQECNKVFYVSPFLGMDMSYAFRVRTPGDRVDIAIQGKDGDGPLITAVLTGTRKNLSNITLMRTLFAYPLASLKVVGAIYWHALQMVLKGFRLYPRSSTTS